MIKRYHIITFGCQMNASDSERIAAVLESINYKPAQKMERADLIVVNMCSVRQSAVNRIYGLEKKLAKLKTNNSQLTTILTGCVLKKDKRKLSRFFDYIIGIKDLSKLPKILSKIINKSALQNFRDRENFTRLDYLKIKPAYANKFSAVVPIMTGCNNFCAYCVVPYARGQEVSRPAKDIICEIKSLIKRGYKEIWLMGQNVNSYKSQIPISNFQQNPNSQNLKTIDFPDLLRMIDKITGDFWIRFTSSHPKDFSDKLIKIMAEEKKITPYLNLPVQAGDDKVLKRMNRPYTIKQYKDIIKKVREKIPNIAISTDIIVGFPGETKKEFQNSVKLFKEIKYDMAYISEYSPRPGTIAAKMKDNVPIKERSERKNILNEILKKTALEKNNYYINKIIEVLPIEYKNGFLFGKSFQYKTVKLKGKKNLIGKFVKAEITDVLPWGLIGKTKGRL